MKNILKKSVFVFMFAFAFLLAGTVVSAASSNTKVSEYDGKYNIEEDTYYALNGSADEVTITLKALRNAKVTWNGAKAYKANVSVLKCESVNADKVCAKWLRYDYADEVATMDDLKVGLVLQFSEELFAENQDEVVNGTELAKLGSAYGLEKTYFVAVQYNYKPTFGQQVYLDAEVYRVVLTENLEPLSISTAVSGTKLTVTVKSGAPITNVSYVALAADLPEFTVDAYDEAFATAGEKAVVLLENPEEAPECVDGVFTQVFEIEGYNTDEHFYVKAADKSGRVDIKNVKTNTDAKEENTEAKVEDPAATNKLVGQIILISLIVIFVIALVLVIIQKIVDYRKRLY